MSTYNGKMIISWDDLVANDIGKRPNHEWYEDQRIKVYYADETDETIIYRDFATQAQKVAVKLISTTERGGKIYLELEAQDGEKYVINSIFAN